MKRPKRIFIDSNGNEYYLEDTHNYYPDKRGTAREITVDTKRIWVTRKYSFINKTAQSVLWKLNNSIRKLIETLTLMK